MQNKLKVLFLPTANGGVVWHRMFQFFRYMRDRGDISPAMDKYDPKRMSPYEWQAQSDCSQAVLAQMENLVRQSDMVVLEYVITDYAIAIVRALQELFPKKPFLAEIDDYCLEINNYSPAFSAFSPKGEATQAILTHLESSDAVIVSTDYLGKLYSKWCKKTKLIPNGIDFKLWDELIKPPTDNIITIGWSGASSHNEDIRYIEKIIYRILEKYPEVQFSFLGGAPKFLVGKERIIADNNWQYVFEYPQYLVNKNYDIGIAPLLDNNFNRGKSNLRWLEYAAMNVPTVASNVEPFKKSIIHGKTGYLCSETEEWFDCLCLLIENEKLRRKIGENANSEVRDKFNVEKISIEYENFLVETYNDFRGRTDKI